MNFVVGQKYRRRDLHKRYGRACQSGISPSASHPVIFLFTGEAGEQHGYQDGPQPDGSYWYTGEGQVGDMKMVRGNRALRDSAANGRTLHLFEEVRSAWVRFLGEATYLGHHETLAPDRTGKQRTAIVFELEFAVDRAAGKIPDPHVKADDAPKSLAKRSPAELRALALKTPPEGASKVERRVNVRLRSQAVRAYVRKRAADVCEGCEVVAPFRTHNGEPYLEPHHIRRLADGGPDHPRWVSALCPNCHRRVHHGEDGRQFNEQLAARIGELEGAP